jgi:hypothetical protein
MQQGHSEFNITPRLTTADITVGNGNDTVDLYDAAGTVHVGTGIDTINISDSDSDIWLGAGHDTMWIGGSVGVTHDGTSIVPVESIVPVGAGHADIWVEDSGPEWTPTTTIDFIHGETGGSTAATADVVRYGIFGASPGSFVTGDLSALTIDLSRVAGRYSTRRSDAAANP